MEKKLFSGHSSHKKNIRSSQRLEFQVHHWADRNTTVDGRNPAPPGMYENKNCKVSPYCQYSPRNIFTCFLNDRVKKKHQQTTKRSNPHPKPPNWRIIPFDKWLITMVRKPPKKGCSSIVLHGLVYTLNLAHSPKWDDPKNAPNTRPKQGIIILTTQTMKKIPLKFLLVGGFNPVEKY